MARCRNLAAQLVSLFLGLALASAAFGQAAILQGGAWTPGHVPQYGNSGNSQPIVIDGGGAGGGAAGVTLSELGITARGTGTPPYAGQGTGPSGTNICDYDAPTTNATGYHYLCFSANAQGGGLIAYGAGGVATALPFNFIFNGTTYAFPFAVGGIVGPPSTVVSDFACWNNTTGTLLKDCGTFANPTASVGLTAVNGTATTPMRSDAAPALSMSIVPTWTGTHHWVQTFTSSSADVSDGMTVYGIYNNQLSASGTTGFNIRLVQDIGTTAIEKGNVVSLGILQTVYNSAFVAGGTTEHGPMVQWLNANPGSTNHNVNYWGCDCTITGPTSGQESFMGYVWQVTKYNSGVTIDGSHFGAIGHAIITSPMGGPAFRSGVTSFPMDAGVVVAGFSGASTVVTGSAAGATNGYNNAFQAGGRASPWMDAATLSKIGTGFYAQDFVNYGLRIGPKHTIAGTGHAIYTESGAGYVGFGTPPVAGIPVSIVADTGAGAGLSTRSVFSDSSALSGPRIELYRVSLSPAVSDLLGRIAALGQDSNLTEINYAYQTAKIVSITPGATAGSWVWGDPFGDWGSVAATGIKVATAFLNNSAVPAASTCGTSPTIATGSSNQGGQFTTGTGTPTACTITFATAYPTFAFCSVQPANAAAVAVTVYVSASSKTAFTVTLGSGTSSAAYNYACNGN